MVILTLALVLATSFVACGDREEARDDLLQAIRRTEQLSYRFVYVDERPDDVIPGGAPTVADTEVQGLVEDDFRFKARVSLNGSTAFDEVVHDDLLAIRFLEPGRVGALVNKEKVAKADTSTELEGVDAVTVLQSRRWVVDESAAPGVTVSRVQEATLGTDPVLDAITALTYVEAAVISAQDVEKYNPDDLTPVYSATEDQFPKPEDGSGVTRYDLRRPKLPPPGGEQGAGGDAGRPATRHFRRMAVYVKDGRVIQVREVIDLKGKFLDDVVKYANTFARAAGAPPEQLEQFSAALDAVPEDERGNFVLEALNRALSATGDEPILRRTMSLDLTDLGADIEVDLPTTDVVRGKLGFLIVTASGKPEATGATSADTGAGTPSAGQGTAPADDEPAADDAASPAEPAPSEP